MKKVLVCLHGWGGSKESFTELCEALKDADIAILIPDLPGFGSEPEPKVPWTTDDYADWVERWIDERLATSDQRSAISLLGHSHGGRIALKLAARQGANSQLPIANCRIEHLFLCAPAGIRHPRHFKRILGLTLAKTGKFFLSIPGFKKLEPLGKKFLYRLVRVHDYEQASPVMRETMIRVSAEDLRPILKEINLPIDLFWGTEDRMTPYSDALLMEKELRGSVLHTYPGIRHRVHRDRATEIAQIIRTQLHV